jgi:hypothetical protein
VQLKDILKEKRSGKVIKGVLFLQENSLGHWIFATQKKLVYLGFHFLDHASCPTDLAPLDYLLFSGLKNNWKFQCFFRSEGHCYRGNLVGRTIFWIFFDWLA